MKRARPDMVLFWDGEPALYWNPDRRCPKVCEYRGKRWHGGLHVEYRRNGDRSRPAPMLRSVKR